MSRKPMVRKPLTDRQRALKVVEIFSKRAPKRTATAELHSIEAAQKIKYEPISYNLEEQDGAALDSAINNALVWRAEKVYRIDHYVKDALPWCRLAYTPFRGMMFFNYITLCEVDCSPALDELKIGDTIAYLWDCRKKLSDGSCPVALVTSLEGKIIFESVGYKMSQSPPQPFY